MTLTATVPRHWESGNIRRFAQMKSGHTPSRTVSAYWEDTDIPWFTLADVWQLRDGKQIYLGDTANKINELGLANSAAELLPAGTVVLSRTASVGFSGIMPKPMATSQDFWNWVCGSELLPEYLNYQFRSMTAEFKSLNMGSTHQTIYQKDAAALQILVPPLEEQRAIADYLDRETARIDTLIEEQQGLIEMLRERRQGVLSLASDGDWPTASLGLLLQGIKDGTHGSFARTAPGEGMPLLGARNVMGSRVVLDGAESFISEEDYESIVANGFPAKGDVLLVIVGATIGKTAVYDLDTRHAFQRSVAFLRPTEHFDPKFLWYQIQASRFQDELTLRAKTSAQPGIYLGDVTAIPVVVPLLEEQRQIVAHLNEQTAKIDTLIAETERFIGLARERRSALITAAVTGQIDVREMV